MVYVCGHLKCDPNQIKGYRAIVVFIGGGGGQWAVGGGDDI